MARDAAPLRLIVNADDLGVSPEVNDAVFDLMAKGRLTSATILANGRAMRKAVAGLARFPQCSFGVHLNITEFPPLTAAPGLRPLLDAGGAMTKAIRRIPLTPALKEAIYEEWAAQIGTLLAAGVPVSHFDSHNHSHNHPGLLPVMRRLRRRFAVPRARVSINLFRPDERKSSLLRLKKRAFNLALRRFCGYRTPDACADFVSFFEVPPARRRPMSCIELMTHPGHARYGDEFRLLSSGDWAARFPCQLAAYHEL